MTETTAETTETTDQTDEAAQPETDWKAEAEKLQRESRKWEDRAKANSKAAKDLEEFRRQSMSEAEKAIEQARTEARQQALVEVGAKVAAAEFRAAAAGRLDPSQVDTLLDGLNLARFIDEAGDVDREAVTRFIDGVAPPAGSDSFPDLGQGNRGTTDVALNGDPLLRDLKSKLGIR